MLLTLAAASLAGCDDGSSTGATEGGGGSTTQPTGGSGGTGGEGAMGGAGGSGGTGGEGAMGGGGSGGAPPECDALPAGPLTPTEVLTVFSGSEDLAFDGKGNIAAKGSGQQILLSSAAGQTSVLATGVPTAYGLRYRPDGFLVVALPNDGKVIQVSPAGEIADVATGMNAPNGLYPDFDGNVWVTEIGGNKVNRINPDGTVDEIVTGSKAAGANGVVFDATRKMLYYTNYGQGRIRRVDLSPGADPDPIDVIQIQGTNPDGLVMDACGHLYVVDQGNSDLYRVKLDAAGNADGDAEMMASFPKNVANAQFGSGPGFDPKVLYVAGNPGTVYALAVGVPGAPVPTPP